MRHRGRTTELLPLLVIALLPHWGCAAKAPPSEPFVAYIADPSDVPPAKAMRANDAALVPAPADPRVQALAQQLAERDRQIAAVRTEIEAAGPPAAGPQPLAAVPVPAAQPETLGAEGPRAAPSAPQAAVGPPADLRLAAVPPLAAAPPENRRTGRAGRCPRAEASPRAVAATEQRLADAQKRIARLEQQLAVEVTRRQEVEAEMTRLLRETSAGPFDKAANVVEKHLREELQRARKEIRSLRATIQGERRERAELERRYAALQAQVQAAQNAAPSEGVSNEEVEALKERQRRVLASIQQDLAASKQREAELQDSLARVQGGDAVSVATEVTSLRSENSALQLRLDEEHQRNRALSAKLQLATRVTDLIYKMQSGSVQGVAAVPLPAE
jgi:septal ring factor EnvC (AmiA/AmiB activator)